MGLFATFCGFVYNDFSSLATETITIPDWVRNNAAWWADGEIDDKIANQALERMQIDDYGLDQMDRHLLKSLVTHIVSPSISVSFSQTYSA